MIASMDIDGFPCNPWIVLILAGLILFLDLAELIYTIWVTRADNSFRRGSEEFHL